MIAKLQFLKDVDATPGWTGGVLTQNFEGSVTITPALQVRDYFEIFKNPTDTSMPRFLREGYAQFHRFALSLSPSVSCSAVAAYQKIAM